MITCTTQLPAVLFLFLSTVKAFPFSVPLDLDVTPRSTTVFNDLSGCLRFRGSAVNYSTLLLEEGTGLLYVGARGAAYALQAANITTHTQMIDWEAPADQKQQCLNKGKDNKTECFNHIRLLQRFNSSHLFLCGTHAFSPLCAYVDSRQFKISSFVEGRDKCPYDPAKGYTGLVIDEQLYTASQYEFRSFPDIRRNFPNPALKTEGAPTLWLQEADFVGSAVIRESLSRFEGDDDKIYFFFTERSTDQSTDRHHAREARVARVCKGDRGGLLTLQKKWTSFLKARLLCSLPQFDFYFNTLRSIFVLQGSNAQNTVLYGIFGLEWKSLKVSAVCQFSMKDVNWAFEGPYMESDANSKWTQYTGRVPEPRPGSCITNELRARNINSSTDLPDDVLHFVRRHPFMYRQVPPLGQRPLLFKKSVYYTQVAVLRVQALDGETHPVLFLGTDDGWLQRAVEVKGRLHIIEELQLFKKPQPVDSIVISETQMSVYVGSATEVLQLPLSNCHKYMSCFDCVLARDPFCAWDGESCVEITSHTNRSSLTQDIVNGNHGCEMTRPDDLVQRSRSVVAGDDVLLQCELNSNLAVPLWTLDGVELQGYGLDSGIRIGTDGLLLIQASPDQSGQYCCFSVESGLRVPVINYSLTVRPDIPPPPPPIKTTLPPRTAPTPRTSLHLRNDTPDPTNPPIPLPLPPKSEFLSDRNMVTLYLSLVTILGGLCMVLTVVLLYVSFCLNGRQGTYSVRAAARKQRKKKGQMELKTISRHCNGKKPDAMDAEDGLLQIIPGAGQTLQNSDHLPPAPPLPPPTSNPESYNGLSATLPSVLRKMNGNSYVLLRQDSTSPLYYSFTEELNRILEKRKQTQLPLTTPDESSV
ncbi:semaphorin-4G [Chanos chanos]|uniref:Semaphorin-4G n=1 Tax=Chanos chanos TaxID=29144 RepID=A0A6J2V0X3_CHACN|nr:semaphorin-4G-like [Chanos chanos]